MNTKKKVNWAMKNLIAQRICETPQNVKNIKHYVLRFTIQLAN